MQWEERRRNAAEALRDRYRSFGWHYIREHTIVILVTCAVMFVVLVVGSVWGLID